MTAPYKEPTRGRHQSVNLVAVVAVVVDVVVVFVFSPFVREAHRARLRLLCSKAHAKQPKAR